MTRIPYSRRYVRFWRADVDGDVDDELRSHVDPLTALRSEE